MNKSAPCCNNNWYNGGDGDDSTDGSKSNNDDASLSGIRNRRASKTASMGYNRLDNNPSANLSAKQCR